MRRCRFIILSGVLLLPWVAVGGCSSEPADRDGAETIELAPRLTDEGDLYRVHIDFAYLNVPGHHGLAEVELIAVGDASVPVRPGTLDGAGFGSVAIAGHVTVGFERTVAPHDLRTLEFRKPNYSARWRISVGPSGGFELCAAPGRDQESGEGTANGGR